MNEDNIKDISKVTEELVGFTTSERKEGASEEQVKDYARKRNKKGVKHEETEDLGDTRKKIYTQRCLFVTILAEAILISRVPYFLVLNKTDSTISVQNVVEDTHAIYLPFESASYMNRPYSFSSKEQVNEYVQKAKKETLDSLYNKVKAIWKKYIDADDFHISICAADTIFTYYQDKLGLTH